MKSGGFIVFITEDRCITLVLLTFISGQLAFKTQKIAGHTSTPLQ